jgi:ABC-type ATPase with predicted acetyltransferase domain
MNLEFEIGGRRFPLEPAELSDGQRALMVLYTIRHAIADGASLLFFDEPDNYLAQREIQPLLAELTGAARNAGATLLVISHHPEVIDYLAPDQVLRLWRGEDGPTRIESVQFDLSMGMTASETLGLEAI